MFKISIITIHCQTNFGSVFQAYALNKYIISLGYACEIIDYRPDYIINNFGYGIKGMVKKLYTVLRGNKSRRVYDRFIRDNDILSAKTYHNLKELKNEKFYSKLYIAGSDQLWNTGYQCGKDDSYKLTFISDAPKMSYATSLNTNVMTDEEVRELKTKIDDFIAVSLREKSAVDFFEKRLSIQAKWVCDPVFLLGSDVYLKLCKKMPYSKYILVYLVDNEEMLKPVIDIIKKRTGYKVIYACGMVPKCKCDIHIQSPGPIEMLSLIRYAEIIITGSFHATAFSHILHKNFFVIEPNNFERIRSLLALTGLAERVIKEPSQCVNMEINIDFSNGQIALDAFIHDSKKWLADNIKKIEVKSDDASC